MSVTYLPEQDRILVRVNTREGEEMRMWLTRRLMVGLWPMLSRVLTEHLLKLEAGGATLSTAEEPLRKMLTEFRKEEFLAKADFDTPYQEGPVALPLGEEPLLVTDVDAAPQASGPLRLTFNERPPDGESPRTFNLEMQPKLMQGLMHLLEQALGQSQWREPFSAADRVAEQQADEDGTSPRRPKYLN